MTLARWSARPPEEANLFNPALCGLLTSEFVKEYQKAKAGPCPFVLPFVALPIALHEKTRCLLPRSTVTSLYTWRERNPNALVGFAARACSLRPAVQEAIRFCIDRKVLAVSEDGHLLVGSSPLAAGQKYALTLTEDAADGLNCARMLGRWFAKAGTASTILSGWGVKP